MTIWVFTLDAATALGRYSASIDRKGDAVDEAGIITGEEDDRRSKFLGLELRDLLVPVLRAHSPSPRGLLPSCGCASGRGQRR